MLHPHGTHWISVRKGGEDASVSAVEVQLSNPPSTRIGPPDHLGRAAGRRGGVERNPVHHQNESDCHACHSYHAETVSSTARGSVSAHPIDPHHHQRRPQTATAGGRRWGSVHFRDSKERGCCESIGRGGFPRDSHVFVQVRCERGEYSVCDQLVPDEAGGSSESV